MIQRDALLAELNQLLQPQFFKDYAPNGLQVQGRDEIRILVSGVTATQALIERAIELKADALLVHHGYFWRNEDPTITGMKYQRLKSLIEHGINLYGYHLPLDAHPELGNNAQLALQLGFIIEGGLQPGEARPVGNVGRLDTPLPLDQLAQRVEQRLRRAPLVIPGGDHPVRRIAWCTGGGQNYIDQAVALGADAFLSGEISEQTVHVARERGIHYIAAGHHATERYGAPAVGRYLADRFGLTHQFVDIDNPA
ncbi:MAG TPA: Nif3-like dinuclear metal center hexameric protein [Dongiaceae bacterium]|nr:Nif3-like dinuclear metal center hexameric protein [Dongiaceae bacterium]